MSDLSLEDLEQLRGKPEFQAWLDRTRIDQGRGTYKDFVERLYQDIDQLIYQFQRTRQVRQRDSEDRITEDLLFFLRRDGYRATHNTSSGGRLDLTVHLGTHSWIGEAKKDGGYKDGLLQLTTRYVQASGNYAHDQGGLLFYLVKTKNAAKVLGNWKEELQASGHTCIECKHNVLALFSVHQPEGSGLDFTIRTMLISLYHDPNDRSGRISKSKGK